MSTFFAGKSQKIFSSNAEEQYMRVIKYGDFKSVYDKIHTTTDKVSEQGSLAAVNLKVHEVDFFNRIPLSKDVVLNGVTSPDDASYGLLNTKNLFIARVKYIPLEEYLKKQNTTGVLPSEVELKDSKIVNLVNAYIKRYIATIKAKEYDITDMFQEQKQKAPKKKTQAKHKAYGGDEVRGTLTAEEQIVQPPKQPFKKTYNYVKGDQEAWNLNYEKNSNNVTIILPQLTTSFTNEDKIVQFGQLRYSQETLWLASDLIGSIRSYETFEVALDKVLKKIFRAVTLPRVGDDIVKQDEYEQFSNYLTRLVQNPDDCYISKSSFLVMCETAIMLKLIRKMFQCNDIIIGIINVINTLIQQENVTYSNIDTETLLDIIQDFGLVFNNNKSIQENGNNSNFAEKFQKKIFVKKSEVQEEPGVPKPFNSIKRGSGINKIHQITSKRYNTNTSNKFVIDYAQGIKNCIFQRIPPSEYEKDVNFKNFLLNERIPYLLFILRHKFKLIFEGNFINYIDNNLFNDTIFKYPLFVKQEIVQQPIIEKSNDSQSSDEELEKIYCC